MKVWYQIAYSEVVSEIFLIELFVDGLTTEIREKVKSSSPTSVLIAYFLALRKEMENETKVFDENTQRVVDEEFYVKYNDDLNEFRDRPKMFNKKFEPGTTPHHREFEGDSVTIEGVFDPRGRMVGCLNYKEDDINKPSSYIVDDEYNMEYPFAMDYIGPWASDDISELIFVTLDHISTAIMGSTVSLLNILSLPIIQLIPMNALVGKELSDEFNFELQTAVFSNFANQISATRGSDTEIVSVLVSRGVHDIMGAQNVSTNNVKPEKYMTTCIHGLRYNCDYWN